MPGLRMYTKISFSHCLVDDVMGEKQIRLFNIPLLSTISLTNWYFSFIISNGKYIYYEPFFSPRGHKDCGVGPESI